MLPSVTMVVFVNFSTDADWILRLRDWRLYLAPVWNFVVVVFVFVYSLFRVRLLQST